MPTFRSPASVVHPRPGHRPALDPDGRYYLHPHEFGIVQAIVEEFERSDDRSAVRGGRRRYPLETIRTAFRRTVRDLGPTAADHSPLFLLLCDLFGCNPDVAASPLWDSLIRGDCRRQRLVRIGGW
jgi:hypothetical protein